MIFENTITDNNSTGLFGISYFIEKYIKYKLGLEKEYLPRWDARVRVFARSDRTLIIDFLQILPDRRKDLEIEVDNEILTNNDLSYNELRNKLQARNIINEYITNMVKNILKTWNSLTNDKSKEKFLRALADMCILRKITLVSKRKMQILRKTGIYRENLDMKNIKEGIGIPPQVFTSNDVLNKEWIEAQKEKPITTKEYLDLFGYTSGEEIYLCIDTIENCENALINDFKYIENVKKFEKRFSISPECKHQDPLSYYKQNLARDVLMHELGHVFGEQKGGRGLYCKQNENEAQMWSSIFLRSEKASMYIEFLSYFQPIEYCLDNQPLLFINGNTEEETIGE